MLHIIKSTHITHHVRVLGMIVLLFVCPLTKAQKVDSPRVAPAELPTWTPFMAVRTNALFDAILIPNIGVEVALPMNFSLAFDWGGTWIKSDRRHFYWQGYGGYLTARYYFGKTAAGCAMTGQHVGIYGSMLTYDIEFGGHGQQGAKPGFGGGIEYGFSLPVGNNLCFDFNIGVGYQGGEYKTYRPTNDGTGHYEWIATRMRNWWGPTKAEISLKYLIGITKKGGKR